MTTDSENGSQQRGSSPPVVDRLDELVGNSPLVRLRRIGADDGPPIYVKMESANPSGSIRDRYVAEILEGAVAAGTLMKGDTVSIAGVDDSAVAAAMMGDVLGIGTRLFAPRDSSRRLLPMIERFGTEVEWTTAEDGLSGAVESAAAWSRAKADRMYVDGYRREAVRDAYTDIAAEILRALDDYRLGAFITSISTGGTFRNVARELREARPKLDVGGAILGQLELPDFEEHRFNRLERFPVEEAFEWRDRIAETEGLLLGPKGAVCVALALQLRDNLAEDQAIVSLNPDAGQRYLGWEDQIEYTGRSTPV